MPSFLPPLIFTILFLFSSSSFVTSPTGIRISESHLRPVFSTTPDVFEVDHNRQLLFGPRNFSLSLHSLNQSRVVLPHPSLSVTVDGKTLSLNNVTTRIISGAGNTVVLHGSSSRVIAAWGPSLHLIPLPLIDKFSSFSHLMRRNLLVNIDHDESNDDRDDEIFESDKQDEEQRVGSSIPCSPPDRHVIEISAAFDSSFCSISNNNAHDTIGLLQALFDEANLPYMRDTCIQLALVHVEGYCSSETDKFSSIFTNIPVGADALQKRSRIFENFRSLYAQQRGSVERDIAYMFSAFEYSPYSSWGRASFPGTCSKSSAYGLVNGASPYVFAHEVGHNLNCGHASSGLMKSSIDRSQLYFSRESVQSMTEFINQGDRRTATSSTCLTTSPALCDLSCPAVSSCLSTQGKCVVPVNPPAGFTSCKQASMFVNCAKPFMANYFQNTTCSTSHPYVQVPFNASDPTVLCCPLDDSVEGLAVFKSESMLAYFAARDVYIITLKSAPQNPAQPFRARFLSSTSVTCSNGDKEGKDESPTPSPSSATPTTSTTPTSSPTPISPSITPSISPVASSSTPSSATPSSSMSMTPSTSTAPSNSASVRPSPSATLIHSKSPSTTPSKSTVPSSSISSPPVTSSSISKTPSNWPVSSNSVTVTASTSISSSSSTPTTPSSSSLATSSISASLTPCPSPDISESANALPSSSSSSSLLPSPSQSASLTPSASEVRITESASYSVPKEYESPTPSSRHVTPTPTESASMIYSPTSSTTMTATATDTKSFLTCGKTTYSLEKHIQCNRAGRVALRVPGVGRVGIRLWTRYGTIIYRLDARNGRRITKFTTSVNGLVEDKHELPLQPFRVSGKLSMQLKDMELERCCGQHVFTMDFDVSICKFDSSCGEGKVSIPVHIKCDLVCRDKEKVGIPMSDDKKCPGCQRIQK